MDSGRLVFTSASSAPPCRARAAAGAGGGGQMLLFGGHVDELDLVDELYDYGCGVFDEHGSSSSAAAAGRNNKRRLTAEQVRALERSFEEEKRKLEPERKSELARRLGIAPRQVAVWFQNRRARWKTKQLELDFDRLRAAHDELLAGRDALAAENQSLRSQVILLTEKLQANGKSPSPAPAEEATIPATVHATVTSGRTKLHLGEGGLYAGGSTTSGGGGAMPAPPAPRLATGREANDSPESYFAGARSPPSSSEDDCGGGSDNDPSSSVLLPDAVLVGASFEEAPLNSWEWFWN